MPPAIGMAIPNRVLAEHPEVCTARINLGLTLYIHEPEFWARGGAAQALDTFLRFAPRERLTYFTTSTQNEWRRITPPELSGLASLLSTPWGADATRHLFSFSLVDHIDVPETAFRYREVSARLSPRRCGWVQFVLPQSSDPETLLALAIELGQRWPHLCAVGGYLADWNPWHKPPAFWDLFRWSKRHLGLDIQDPDAMGWRVHRGIPGTNWITLLNRGYIDGLGMSPDELVEHEWKRDITTLSLEHGVLIRAGAKPSLGDVNLMEYPFAYGEVAQRLAPYILATPPRMCGGFWESELSRDWLTRLVEPEGWT